MGFGDGFVELFVELFDGFDVVEVFDFFAGFHVHVDEVEVACGRGTTLSSTCGTSLPRMTAVALRASSGTRSSAMSAASSRPRLDLSILSSVATRRGRLAATS